MRCRSAHDLTDLLERYEGRRPVARAEPSQTALLVYTSGNTGSHKGEMVSHSNRVFAAAVWRDWSSITPADVEDWALGRVNH